MKIFLFFVKTFNCGVVNSAANAGKTLTVELRLTNPEDASKSKVVGTYSYTFTA